MRRTLSLLLVLLFCLSGLASASSLPCLQVSDKVLETEGETFTLDIRLEGSETNYGGSFVLVYDSACLELIEMAAGDGISGSLSAINPSLGDGVAKMNWVSVTPLGGSGVIARLQFRSLREESSQVELLNASLLGSDGGNLPVQVTNGQITAPGTTTVPVDPPPSGNSSPDSSSDGSSSDRPSSGGTLPSDPTAETGGGQAPSPFRFTDVPDNSWAAVYIYRLYDLGVIDGVGNGLFAPTRSITRAEFVKLLAGISGTADKDLPASSHFTDVPSNRWYAPYVVWAATQGIVSGTSATTFAPNAKITREQMATMLYRYALSSGIQLPSKNSAVKFADADQFSDWAAEPIAAVQRAGIIDGTGNGCFSPSSPATREQACKMVSILLSLSDV